MGMVVGRGLIRWAGDYGRESDGGLELGVRGGCWMGLWVCLAKISRGGGWLRVLMEGELRVRGVVRRGGVGGVWVVG